jgi:2-C-methyl-D-erythritol 4-phosphate cytidylyltransferase
MSGLTSHISNLTSKCYAIIVAGGSGTRMQSALPKQFLELNGKPVLMYTLEAFLQVPSPELILCYTLIIMSCGKNYALCITSL